MQGNIHQLGLGIIRQITSEVEKDTGVTGIFDAIEPNCKEMLQSYFPEELVNIHPLAQIGWKLLNSRSGVEQKTVNLKDDLGK